ncbi:hypothetical protein HAX54_002867, partial [Datura stramonium]|nr:hypothetical protein [Datura stramonium]
ALRNLGVIGPLDEILVFLKLGVVHDQYLIKMTSKCRFDGSNRFRTCLDQFALLVCVLGISDEFCVLKPILELSRFLSTYERDFDIWEISNVIRMGKRLHEGSRRVCSAFKVGYDLLFPNWT